MKPNTEVVSHVTDADTVNGIRITGLDTKESVGNSKNITQEGKDASKFAKKLFPTGSEIKTTGDKDDMFGRRLRKVERVVNGVNIDTSLVTMDQKFSDYNIRYGESDNPQDHELYKHYYSQYSDYQEAGAINPHSGVVEESFRDEYKPLNEAEYIDMTAKHKAFSEATAGLESGSVSQEDFNAALVNLYQDSDKVVRFRQDTFDMTQPTRDDGSMRYKMGQLTLTPEQTYMRNLSVKNTESISKTVRGKKEVETTNSEALDVAFSKFNTVALSGELLELNKARRHGKSIEVDESVYTAGVPDKYLPMIQEEAANNGGYAAQILSKQLMEDIEDGRLFDNLEWYEQLGYGAMAFIIDPTTLVTGGAVKAAQGSAMGLKLASKSSGAQMGAIQAGKTWQATGIKYGTSATKWGIAGAAEESVAGAVRLAADHTYTVKDLQMDIMAGFVLGGTLAPLAKAGKESLSSLGGWKKITEATRKMNAEFNAHKEAKAKHTAAGGKHQTDVIGDFEAPTTKTVVNSGEPTSNRVNSTQVVGGLDAVQKTVVTEKLEIEDPDFHYKKHVDDSLNNIYAQIEGFTGSSEKADLDKALKGNLVSKVVSMQWAGNVFTDVATRLQKSKVDSLQWFGLNVTESGKGFGGAINRKATGGLMKRMIADRSLGKVLPAYAGYIDQYAASKGSNAWGKLNAQQMDGKSNPMVKQFHEEMFTYMENTRLGKEIGEVSDSVKMFADEWNGYMAHNHKELVRDVKGFTADRARTNYIPRITSPSKLKSMEKVIGKSGVLKLLRSGFEEIDVRTGVKVTDEGFVPVNTRASKYFKSIEDKKWADSKGKNVDMEDDYSPLADAASRERVDFDITHSVHIDGVDYRIMDLLNTEIPEIATKYSERTSGYIGLSKSTGGAISTPLDISSMRAIIKKESVDKGLSTREINNNLSMYDDIIDQMLGRPSKFFKTEGALGRAERAVTGTNMVGLPEEVRQFKDATALAQLGGLGAAQLAEIGDAVQRKIMNSWDNRGAVDKLLDNAGINIASKEDRDAALREITEYTGLIKEMEWLDRQAVHIDQGDLEHIGTLRQASLQIVDTLTFGKHKAPASRLLSKTTGFNLIRKKQFEVVQSSTATAIARVFTGRNTSMNRNRIRDLGLDTPDMKAAMKNVEFSDDNQVISFHFDKWEGETMDTFIYGIYRDATQSVQRTLVGEKMTWLNRPMMQLLTQYLEMPIIAMNKKLGRQAQFADKEAVLNMAVLSAMGGLTKYAYDEAARFVKGDEKESQEVKDLQSLVKSDTFQAMKYTPVFGFVPDVMEWVANPSVPNPPILSMMKKYGEAGAAANDVATGDGSAKDFIDTAARLAPLSTTIYAKAIENLNDKMTK